MKSASRPIGITLLLLIGMVLLGAAAEPGGGLRAPRIYHSPYDAAFSPDGKILAVSDETAKAIAFIDPASGKIVRETYLAAQPRALVWTADGSKVLTSQYDDASVAEINAADGKMLRRIEVGRYPSGLALAAKRQLLLAGNTGLSYVSVIDLPSGKEKARINVLREPFAIAITPDESIAVVSNLLPAGSAADPLITSAVSLIDLETMRHLTDIKLPPNSTCIRGVAISPNGRWAYIVHTLGRTTLPATQLERGWVNTNALSVIDLRSRQVYASLLMDNLSEGAADPWGITLSKDGQTAWISLAGVHQIARVDLAGVHRGLEGKLPPALDPAVAPKGTIIPPATAWHEIKADPAKRADLVNDLAAMYVGGVITRTNLPGKSPRGIAVSGDGKQVALAMHYSGEVLMVDGESSKVLATISMGPQSQPDDVRLGEMIFHDAHYSFQHWLSCATCHPNQGRADGLNWDLPNDGIGNPKSAKSLLHAQLTPPAMWTGIRENMETAAAAGFRFAARQAEPHEVKAVQAYIRSLRPQVSPYRLANGELSEAAKRGQVVFQSAETKCAECHMGPEYTNLQHYNVGTQGELDHKDQDTFDTPTLIELWRTAPYLHDGRAATIEDIFTKFNAKDLHGKTSHLNKQQIDDLAEYLLSL